MSFSHAHEGTQAAKTGSFPSRMEICLRLERDLSAGQIKRWSAIISLPLRHLAYVVVSSVSNKFAAYKNILSEAYVVENRIAMMPNIEGRKSIKTSGIHFCYKS